MLTVLLLQLVCADGRGEPAPSVPVGAREAPRVRAAVGFIVASGLGFRSTAVGFGPGLTAELGATFGDRFSVVARASLGTILMASSATAGVGVDLALSDRWSLGLGVALATLGGIFITDLPYSLSFGLPVHAVFAPFGRAAHELGRRGLVLFAELTPGYEWVTSRGYRPANNDPLGPPVSIAGLIGVGYAWW